jgi:son of sevenless
MEPPVTLTPEEYDVWKEKKLRPTQHQVLTVFTMWLEDHNMLREDPHIVRRLKDFLLAIRQPQSLALTANLMLQAIERLVCMI